MNRGSRIPIFVLLSMLMLNSAPLSFPTTSNVGRAGKSPAMAPASPGKLVPSAEAQPAAPFTGSAGSISFTVAGGRFVGSNTSAALGRYDFIVFRARDNTLTLTASTSTSPFGNTAGNYRLRVKLDEGPWQESNGTSPVMRVESSLNVATSNETNHRFTVLYSAENSLYLIGSGFIVNVFEVPSLTLNSNQTSGSTITLKQGGPPVTVLFYGQVHPSDVLVSEVVSVNGTTTHDLVAVDSATGDYKFTQTFNPADFTGPSTTSYSFYMNYTDPMGDDSVAPALTPAMLASQSPPVGFTVVVSPSTSGTTPPTNSTGTEVRSVSVSLAGSKSVVRPGEQLAVSGHVYITKCLLFSSGVESDVKLEDVYQLNVFASVTTDANGYFTAVVSVPMTSIIMGSSFTLRAEATPHDSTYYGPGGTRLTVQVETIGNLGATISTDKPVYSTNDIITVSGNVTAYTSTGAVLDPNAGVAVFMDMEPVGVSQVDSNGRYQFSFGADTVKMKPGQILTIFTEGVHFVTVKPTDPGSGYTSGYPPSVYFVIQDTYNSYTLLNLVAVASSGHVRVYPPTGDPKPYPYHEFSNGSKYTQGFKLTTESGGYVVLQIPLNGNAVATAVVGSNSSIKIARYYQDKSGAVYLVLYVSNPGRVLVNIDNPDGVALNFKIVTPSATATASGTEFYVLSEDDGSSTVVTLKGKVLVSDFFGAEGQTIGPGNQLTVALGDSPANSTVSPQSTQVDPTIEAALAASQTATTSSPSSDIPGFPIESVITGLALVLLTLIIFRRFNKPY